MVDISSKRKFY